MSTNPVRLPPLDLLVSFEAVARQGSITRAAAERFITQSAMSRQVQALEEALGTPLFERGHRSLALTEAGRQLQATCVQVLAQLRESVTAIRAPLARELLALTTSPGFAALWLIPRLAGFTRAHPGVDVRLDASFEQRDLKRDGFDLAVRYGPVRGASGEPLFGETVVPVCSPALLASGAAPLAVPADVAQHTLLQVAPLGRPDMPVEWESWLQAQQLAQLRPRATLTFNNYHEAIAAAVAGQGLALGKRPLIDALLQQGQLVRPFCISTESARGYFLLQSASTRGRPAVQALAQWLLDQAHGVGVAAGAGGTLAAASPAEPAVLSRSSPGGGQSPASAPTGSAHKNGSPARRPRSSVRTSG